jgi:hypothetical protein
LKILSEAGLIACRKEGQYVYSQTVPETIEAYTQALTKSQRESRNRGDASAKISWWDFSEI